MLPRSVSPAPQAQAAEAPPQKKRGFLRSVEDVEVLNHHGSNQSCFKQKMFDLFFVSRSPSPLLLKVEVYSRKTMFSFGRAFWFMVHGSQKGRLPPTGHAGGKWVARYPWTHQQVVATHKCINCNRKLKRNGHDCSETFNK